MPGRQSLPHQVPEWVDPSSEVWFITICCQERGVNQLTNKTVASSVIDSIAYRYELRQWYPHIFLLMPDHCHALLSFPSDESLAKVVRNWKRWVATHCHITWQRDFFEHRIRSGLELSLKTEYIQQNPVRAGLVNRAGDWPWIWRAETCAQVESRQK